jgi:hypothetical protein
MTGVPGGGPEPAKSTTPNAGRRRRPRPARRTGSKHATGSSTGHRCIGEGRDPEHLIAANRKSQPAWDARRLRSPAAARARFEDSLIAMTGNRSAVSATRMRAQITLFGVTIAFVPADQDCRAEHFRQDWFERRFQPWICTRLSSGDPQQPSRRLVVSCRWSRSWPCAELTADRVSCRRTAGPGLAGGCGNRRPGASVTR